MTHSQDYQKPGVKPVKKIQTAEGWKRKNLLKQQRNLIKTAPKAAKAGEQEKKSA